MVAGLASSAFSSAMYTTSMKLFRIQFICHKPKQRNGPVMLTRTWAKDSDPKAKDMRYQGQIFHRSSPYIIFTARQHSLLC